MEEVDVDAISVHSLTSPLFGDSDPIIGVALHSMGVYGISPSGKHVTFSGGSQVFSNLVFPVSESELMLFRTDGLYKINIQDGNYTKLGKGGWDYAKAAARSPIPDKLIVFHSYGIYRVDVNDGTHEAIVGGSMMSSDGWGGLTAIAHDPNTPE